MLELQARSLHPASEPAMRVVISGRRSDLEPRPGETADSYRARIEPLTKDPTSIEVTRVQFETFVARVRDALHTAMPEAAVDVVTAQARIARPEPENRDRPSTNEPTARNYDPYVEYFPSPMSSMLNVMMWSSMFSMMHTPNVVVVNSDNVPTGHAADPGIEYADPVHSEYAESASPEGRIEADSAADHGDSSSSPAGNAETDVGGGDVGGGDW